MPFKTRLWNWLTNLTLCKQSCFVPGLLGLDDESNSSAHCWVVLKISTVFLTRLWASPLLLFSAQILAWRRRNQKREMLMQHSNAPNCCSLHPDPRPLIMGGRLSSFNVAIFRRMPDVYFHCQFCLWMAFMKLLIKEFNLDSWLSSFIREFV